MVFLINLVLQHVSYEAKLMVVRASGSLVVINEQDAPTRKLAKLIKQIASLTGLQSNIYSH